MHFRELGRTKLQVSEIGLGTEHLFRQPEKVVKSVISKCIENKINYFDVLFSVNHYLEKLSLGFKDYRDQIIITGHIGTTESDERPKRTRDIGECSKAFLRLLKVLQIDYVDVVNIQFVKANEINNVIKQGGLLDLAISFREQGKARYVGLSTHDTSVALRALNTEKFDVIMFPLNITNHVLKGKNEFLALIKEKNIGLVAIKPFAAGHLLMRNRTVRFAKYQTGGLIFKKKNPRDITTTKCLNYVRSIPEVSTILMGVKNKEELLENLSFITKQEEKADYSKLIEFYQN